MSYKLTDFLVSLANPQSLTEYQRDPDAFMMRAGLDEQQRQAIRDGDLYRIRRLSSEEMLKSSLHAQMLMRIYNEHDPSFKYSSVTEDAPVNTDHDIVQTHDLGDDIAEFSARYNHAHYYDHLFDTSTPVSKPNELVFVGT